MTVPDAESEGQVRRVTSDEDKCNIGASYKPRVTELKIVQF